MTTEGHGHGPGTAVAEAAAAKSEAEALRAAERHYQILEKRSSQEAIRREGGSAHLNGAAHAPPTLAPPPSAPGAGAAAAQPGDGRRVGEPLDSAGPAPPLAPVVELPNGGERAAAEDEDSDGGADGADEGEEEEDEDADDDEREEDIEFLRQLAVLEEGEGEDGEKAWCARRAAHPAAPRLPPSRAPACHALRPAHAPHRAQVERGRGRR